MIIGAKHAYLEGEPGAGGGGAAGQPAGTDPTAGGAGAAAGQPGATPGDGAPAGGTGDPAGSALSTAGAPEWTIDSIPEKFRVKDDAGELDLQATIRKVEEHRSHLEKRMGSGDLRPKAPTDYTLPEAFKDLPLDEAATARFREEAHEMGLSQKQYEGVLNKWKDLAPQLVEAGAKESTETTLSSLREHWKDGFDAEMRGAFRAVNSVAEKAGLSFDDVDGAIGNNPVAIRLFAALSKEMSEDRTPASANGAIGGGAQTAQQVMAENWQAYNDPKDPKHAAVTARVAELFKRENPEART